MTGKELFLPPKLESFTIHHSPFTIHYSPFTIHHSLFTIHYSLFTIHHSLFTIHHSPFTIHYSPFTIHYSLFTIHISPSKLNDTGPVRATSVKAVPVALNETLKSPPRVTILRLPVTMAQAVTPVPQAQVSSSTPRS